MSDSSSSLVVTVPGYNTTGSAICFTLPGGDIATCQRDRWVYTHDIIMPDLNDFTVLFADEKEARKYYFDSDLFQTPRGWSEKLRSFGNEGLTNIEASFAVKEVVKTLKLGAYTGSPTAPGYASTYFAICFDLPDGNLATYQHPDPSDHSARYDYFQIREGLGDLTHLSPNEEAAEDTLEMLRDEGHFDASGAWGPDLKKLSTDERWQVRRSATIKPVTKILALA